jgi:geranylgeranyl diphosphate synthase type II
LNRLQSIEQYIEHHAARIQKELKHVFPPRWEIPERLREAMDYSLLAGGKRMRPVLVLAAAESLSASADAAMPVACAVEMIHTYSLIHDDLPAMDNDDYRRGRLTNHKVYGEAMAILAGDALLTHAFHHVVQSAYRYGVPASQVLMIIEEMSALAGARGMVGGQAADILGEQGITSLSQLEYIHAHKTSDLIIFSLKAGGRIADAADHQLRALEQFGSNIGLAFQIQDDILDVVGDEKKLGKPIKSDEKAQKVTYPYFIGVDASKDKVKQLTMDGKEMILHAGFPKPERLLEIADFLMKRDH